MIELRLIYSFEKIIDTIWGHISKDVDRVLEFSRYDVTKDMIFNEIISNMSTLWLIFRDKKYLGFLITKIIQAPLTKRILLIYLLFAKEPIQKEEYVEGFKQLLEYAKDMQCDFIDFYTVRDKAFERKVKDLGFLPKYTIFTLEVK